MIALLQRVIKASVHVDNEQIAQINQGLLVFIGVEPLDDADKATRLLDKILRYRIFADEADKMNLSLLDINGGLLLVPQFTLAANTQKGLRPSFSTAATPQQGNTLYTELLDMAKQRYPSTSSGRFGSDMQVSLINDGPVTFWLQV